MFDGGLPVALIDFDLARPTTRVADIANALYWWAPLVDPVDRAPSLVDADVPARVRAFADAYEMTTEQRAQVVPVERTGWWPTSLSPPRLLPRSTRSSGGGGRRGSKIACHVLSPGWNKSLERSSPCCERGLHPAPRARAPVRLTVVVAQGDAAIDENRRVAPRGLAVAH